MNKYQKSLIAEHMDLVIKINALDNYIYNGVSTPEGRTVEQDNKVEFANKCIQLKGMRMYAEALEARLANVGIIFEDGLYLHNVATIVPSSTEDQVGSDFDVDSEKDEKRDISDNN